MRLRISNRQARHLILDVVGLTPAPVGRPDVHAIIERLGFVQLDTIRMVARAHDHILWSRNQNYREPMLDKALADDRQLFEHFTHDASVLPIGTYPFWRRQFSRMAEKKGRSGWYEAMPDRHVLREIKSRIAQEGPLSTNDFDYERKKTAMWQRPPHKLALDFMWYSGELATAHRRNFTKFYDLAERVIPNHVRATSVDDDAQVDWLCRSAMERLGAASPGEIMRFWEAASLAEVKRWLAGNAADLVEVEIACSDGGTFCGIAPADIEHRLDGLEKPTTRLRILNPFDPLIRDRARLSRLFGFDYRIEIFVPADKRVWGYYVCPVLEGDRFVGRIEVKADRKAGVISVLQFWAEPGVQWTPARWRKLDAELERMCRFVEATQATWSDQAWTARRRLKGG